jgi:flagellar hook-length control protein FliK
MGFTPVAAAGTVSAANPASRDAATSGSAGAAMQAGAPGVFPAVLQALRAPAGTPAKPGAAPVLPTSAQDATGLDAPPPFSLQLPIANADTLPAAAANPLPPGTTDDQTLPPDGTTLPPGLEIEALLGSLALPASAVPPTAGVPPSPPSVATKSPAQELPGLPVSAAGAQAGRPNSPNASTDKPGDAAVSVDGLPALPIDAGSTPLNSLPAAGDAASPAPDLASLQAPGRRNELLTAALQAMRTPVDAGSATTSLPIGPTANASNSSSFGAAAPLPDAMPTLQPLVGGEAWSKNLGDRLLMMAENGMQTARLKLHPEHLGPLEIRISVDDNGASQVWFSAHHSQTREAIEQALPRLRELFAEQGLNLAHTNVDSGRGAFAQRHFAAQADSWAQWASDEPAIPATANLTSWQIARGSSRRLDVTV